MSRFVESKLSRICIKSVLYNAYTKPQNDSTITRETQTYDALNISIDKCNKILNLNNNKKTPEMQLSPNQTCKQYNPQKRFIRHQVWHYVT